MMEEDQAVTTSLSKRRANGDRRISSSASFRPKECGGIAQGSSPSRRALLSASVFVCFILLFKQAQILEALTKSAPIPTGGLLPSPPISSHYKLTSTAFLGGRYFHSATSPYSSSRAQLPLPHSRIPEANSSPYSSLRRPSSVLLAAATESAKHSLDGKSLPGPLIPIYDRLLVFPNKPETTTASGLVLPSDGRGKLSTAKVLAVGTGYLNHYSGVKVPLDVQTGDWIVFDSQDGQTLKYDEEDCKMLGSRDVLGILRNSVEGKLTATNVEPLLDVVLVKLMPTEDKTASGLILSTGDKTGSYNGEVVAVGKGGFDMNGLRIAPEVSVGDFVRLSAYAYQGGEGRQDRDFQLDDQKFVFLRTNDVLVKWRGKPSSPAQEEH